MSEDSNSDFWCIVCPAVWPRAPQLMSFSTLIEVETCPRRWALSSADYPHIWKHRGYPRPLRLIMLEGVVVHRSLQRITGALAERGCPSLKDESAVSILRELGGYTAIILNNIEQVLQPYKTNPRAVPVLEGIRYRFIAQIPELRSKVQRLLSRINLESRPAAQKGIIRHQKGELLNQLRYGSHAEVELRASELGWHGVADLLTLSTTRCEIRDFKTGTSKQEHEVQLRIYALLWARDHNLNPSGRLANKLLLSYDKGDVEVPALTERALFSIEKELKERTATALADLHADPPSARPSSENCTYCAVRHLCEEYWDWYAQPAANNEAKGRFIDIQIKIFGPHGPSSWDGVVEIGQGLRIDEPILLRTANLPFVLHPGQRLRLLNTQINVRDEESVEDACTPVILTMGANSEGFLLPM